jgi:hypothetical protein
MIVHNMIVPTTHPIVMPAIAPVESLVVSDATINSRDIKTMSVFMFLRNED